VNVASVHEMSAFGSHAQPFVPRGQPRCTQRSFKQSKFAAQRPPSAHMHPPEPTEQVGAKHKFDEESQTSVAFVQEPSTLHGHPESPKVVHSFKQTPAQSTGASAIVGTEPAATTNEARCVSVKATGSQDEQFDPATEQTELAKQEQPKAPGVHVD